MPNDNPFQLGENTLNKVRYFIQDNDGNRVARNLRKVFFDYMRFQQGSLDVDFDEMLDDFENVILLMEMLGEERRHPAN